MKLFDLTKHRSVRLLSWSQGLMIVVIIISAYYFIQTVSILGDAYAAYKAAMALPRASPEAAAFAASAVNAADVAQGTTGIAATFLSALLVAVGLLQVAKGNTIVRIENRRDRGMAKIDQLLAHRHLAITDSSVATSPEAACEAHAVSYWGRLKAYAKLRPGYNAEDLKTNLDSAFRAALDKDPYLTYMSQIFQEAELLSDLGAEIAQEGIDHAWMSLSNEERLLCLIARFLNVGTIKLPSAENIRPWQAAAGNVFPWSPSDISLEDVFNHAKQCTSQLEPAQRFYLRLWNQIWGTSLR